MQIHHFDNKKWYHFAYSQSYGFSSSSEWKCESDHKEDWVWKNWCLQTVVLEKTLESPLDSKEIQLVILKEINPEYSLGGLILIEALILWPPDAKSRLTGKNPDAGKDWGRRRGGNRGWDGWVASLTQQNDFEQTLGDGEGQGSLACCSPWGCKELGTT